MLQQYFLAVCDCAMIWAHYPQANDCNVPCDECNWRSHFRTKHQDRKKVEERNNLGDKIDGK